MKSKMLKYSLPTLLLLITHLSFCQVVNKKEKSQTFYAPSGTTLEVENKYGNIHLSNWNKDSVYVVMKMVAKAKNREKLEKTLKDIDFRFRKAAGFITISTSVSIGTFGQLSEELFKSNDDVEINYYIKAPYHTDLRLQNKFGNIYMEEAKGKVDITLSHGDLKAKKIDGRLNLNHSFGDADFNSLQTAYLELNYVELHVNEGKFIDINSKSSDIIITEAHKVIIDARRGDIDLGKIETVHGNITFCDVTVGGLIKELNLESQYGNILLEMVENNFNLININTKYTDVAMTFKSNTSFIFDMTHRKTDFIYSKNNSSLQTKTIEDGSKKEYDNTYGNFGNNASTSSRVRINIENGDLKVVFN